MLESRQKIEIPLRTIAGIEHKKLGPNIRQTIENEYAIKYLERIGVQPTKEKIEFMLSNMPVEKALVVPVWTRSALVMVPERIEETDPNVIKQIYTGSKDIEISKRKGTSFFGNGVSEPGSTERQLKRLNTATSTKSRRKSERNIIYVDITYPYTTTLPLMEVRTANFQQLIKPLAVSDGRLKMAIKSFSSSLSNYVPRIFDDTTGKMNVIIQKFLGCLLCRRLFGLLCHYVFWNIVHPFARRTLLAARAQHGQSFMSSSANQQLDLSSSNFARRKNMVSFTKAGADSMKKMINLTAGTGIEINPKSISKGGIILNRAVAMINANRAMNAFGMTALGETSPNTQHHVGFHPSAKEDQGIGENELQSTLSGGATLSSDASLTSEEKETLYCQLEECLNKLHTQMGFSRQALINARQGLVAGCHFIVNEILCAHYPWLGGKREVPDVMTPVSTRYTSSRPSTGDGPSNTQSLDQLSDRDLAMIHGLREHILKLVNETLTNLLDPAKVYCDKIMKEMFHDDDEIPLEIIEEKKKLEKTGEIATPSRSQYRGKQNKYYATSIAVRAVFSEENNHDTRKFLGMNSRAPTPLISGKSKRKGHIIGIGIDAERSQMSILTPLTMSLVSPTKGGDSLENDSTSLEELTSSPIPTIKEFKSLFVHDRKEHPRDAPPKFNPNNSLLYRRSESIQKTMNSEGTNRMKLTRGLSKNFHRTLSRQHSSSCDYSRQPSMDSEADEMMNENEHVSIPEPEPEPESVGHHTATVPLNVNTKSKLMSLVVQRSKSKYQDKHILQYSRTPNARYREELLASGC